MQPGDWFNAIFSVAIGALLGSVAKQLLDLVVTGNWLVALILFVGGGGCFLLLLLSDKLIDVVFGRLFSIGVRPPRKEEPRLEKPWPRVLALPAGFLLGAGLASVGLDTVLLDALS